MAELVVFLKGSSERKRVRLARDEVVVGRASACDLTIGHPSLSREHLCLRRDHDGWHVRDLGSTRGTIVNGKRITEETGLGHNDLLRAGSVCLVLWARDQVRPLGRDPNPPPAPSRPAVAPRSGPPPVVAPAAAALPPAPAPEPKPNLDLDDLFAEVDDGLLEESAAPRPTVDTDTDTEHGGLRPASIGSVHEGDGLAPGPPPTPSLPLPSGRLIQTEGEDFAPVADIGHDTGEGLAPLTDLPSVARGDAIAETDVGTDLLEPIEDEDDDRPEAAAVPRNPWDAASTTEAKAVGPRADGLKASDLIDIELEDLQLED